MGTFPVAVFSDPPHTHSPRTRLFRLHLFPHSLRSTLRHIIRSLRIHSDCIFTEIPFSTPSTSDRSTWNTLFPHTLHPPYPPPYAGHTETAPAALHQPFLSLVPAIFPVKPPSSIPPKATRSQAPLPRTQPRPLKKSVKTSAFPLIFVFLQKIPTRRQSATLGAIQTGLWL